MADTTPEADTTADAFDAAHRLVEHLAVLAGWARGFDRNAPLYPPGTDGHMSGHDKRELSADLPRVPLDWGDKAWNFATAFIAWYDLTELLTPAVRSRARRVYPPGSPSVRLGTVTSASVVPAIPASVTRLLTPFRRVQLDATPYPTVIEALADGLGVHVRNAVFAERRHPLEPDTDRIASEAKARAVARQVALGKPAEPSGWEADYQDLMRLETHAAVRARLDITSYGDLEELMMREWRALDMTHGEASLYLLRCNPVNFPELRMHLIREAEAAVAATSGPLEPTVVPGLLERLHGAAAAVETMVERAENSTSGAAALRNPPRLPKLKKWAWEAWQANQVGVTATKIAETLSKKYRDPKITQPRVSEQIKCAQRNYKASGLAELAARVLPMPEISAPARTLDPAVGEQGRRTDGRAAYLREKEKQKAKDNADLDE